MMTRHYKVAGHTFAVSGSAGLFKQMGNYEPFECEGKGYMFLGPSGIGKSTHARMWLLNVEGTKLVNDDFPVVRDGVVYGSPWGGFFTSCYRNVCYPIGGMVNLSQAPYNKIHRLSGIEAYLTLYCRDIVSFLGYPIAEDIADDLHQTKDKLAQTIPMWHLECLPDEAAARLCYETITVSPQEADVVA